MTYSNRIEAAARLAIHNGMIDASEFTACVTDATRRLEANGSVYLCGETIRLSHKEQDAVQAARIQRMTPAQFDRFAIGL